MTARSSITICEFDELHPFDDGTRGYLPQETFDSLANFIGDVNKAAGDDYDKPHDVLKLWSGRNGKTLKAQNYVGVISANDTVIEILPKIAYTNIDDRESQNEVRQVFVEMLECLNDTPFKHLGKASLSISHISILELFISSFLDEVKDIIRRGMRSDYVDWFGNERFMKGRLNFGKHILLNHSDKSRFAIEYAVYHVNRPENRLIKSTLKLLSRKSRDPGNRRQLRIALDYFDEVPESSDYVADISACKRDRNMAHYDTAIVWCRVFLAGESFTSFPGLFSADALLFPMERVFQDYVASKLRTACSSLSQPIAIRAQDHSKYLFEKPAKKYLLLPDIVAQQNGHRIILDTKWKLHDQPLQADMYQMFAYAMKYEDTDDIVLVYPSKVRGVSKAGNIEYESHVGDRVVRIRTFEFGLGSNGAHPSYANAQPGETVLANYIAGLFKNRDRVPKVGETAVR